MGRGSSGLGGIPNINQTNVSSLNDDVLKTLESELDDRIKSVKDELYAIARQN